MPYETGKDATPSLALGEIGRAITPNDTNDIVPYPRSVYVGVAGDVRFLPAKNVDGAYLTLPFAAGAIIPWKVRRVYSTGTTATSLAAID